TIFLDEIGDIAAAVQPSLVTVSTQQLAAGALAAGDASGLVDGFAVSADGLILTSAHAVRGATRLRVATAGGRSYDATVAASDLVHGLVVLRATAASGLTPLRISAARPRIGDLGVAVFHPALGTLSTRSGVVATVGMNAEDGTATLTDLLSIDAAAAPDADGAPLVDATGALTGVVTAVLSQPGVTAASARDAATLLAGVQRGAPVSAPTFGVTSLLLGPAIAAAAALPQGALIEAVAPGGPAAGLLQPGDVVTSVNGTAVSSVSGLRPDAFGLLAGDSATLAVTGAGGAGRTVTITPAPG
ncbi:MAG: serine protease, partial [Pseudonocardiales bacterium]|nr:serine protease [Pseudonocardiales bacterium]